ncbi:MAG TPA: lasso peptide biosynthesis B2 protein [Candidatus Dormibacteraeota bacterium]|nr:lasso peptide biosynthesis B2 protein [Candidatus Dormibacteraeota bacterium]
MFLWAMFALPLVSQSLRWRGLRATQESLQRRQAPGRKPTKSESQKLEVTVRMVKAAVRHGLGHPTCLEESLTLWWLLASQGIPSEVRIGIRKQAENFEAHAWVERDGIALNEPEAKHRHYEAFASEFPPAGGEIR